MTLTPARCRFVPANQHLAPRFLPLPHRPEFASSIKIGQEPKMCETEGIGAVGRGGARKTGGFLTAALDGLWRLKTVRNPVRKSFSGCQTSCVFSAGGMMGVR